MGENSSLWGEAPVFEALGNVSLPSKSERSLEALFEALGADPTVLEVQLGARRNGANRVKAKWLWVGGWFLVGEAAGT